MISTAAVATAAIAGIVAAVSLGGSAPTSPPAFDYNCDLPGFGYPWLAQWEPKVEAPDSESGEVTVNTFWDEIEAPAWWAGFFTSADGYVVALPAAVGADHRPVSMENVYRMLCDHHPQLGGSGLRPLAPAELLPLEEYIDDSFTGDMSTTTWMDVFTCIVAHDGATTTPGYLGCMAAIDENDPANHLYTDGVVRADDEAYMWGPVEGGIRVYGLPPMTPQQLAALGTTEETATTSSTSTTATTIDPGRKRWRVEVRGHELWIADWYWRETTSNPQRRRAIRFDYTLTGELITRARDGETVFESGAITSAKVETTDLFTPEYAFEVQILSCRTCDEVRSAKRLDGTVVNGNEIVLHWGLFQPEVEYKHRNTLPCSPPQDGCNDWPLLSNRAVSDHFFTRVNEFGLVLQDGFSNSETNRDPRGDLWLQFTVDLHLLP